MLTSGGVSRSVLTSGSRRLERANKLTIPDLRDEFARAGLADELEGVHPVVLEEPPARPALFEGFQLPVSMTFHEVERHPRAVLQPPSSGVHVRENGGRAEEVFDVEASGRAGADQVDRLGTRAFEIAGY